MTTEQRKAKLYKVLNETYKDNGLRTGDEIREHLNSWATELRMDQFFGEKLRELREERRRARWDPSISPTAITVGLSIGAALFLFMVFFH